MRSTDFFYENRCARQCNDFANGIWELDSPERRKVTDSNYHLQKTQYDESAVHNLQL